MTKIIGSLHKLLRDFKEWIHRFSEDDFITTKYHLYTFIHALEPYDKHKDVRMRLLSYTLIGRVEEWYDSIFPRTITSWDIFLEHFATIFKKNKYS